MATRPKEGYRFPLRSPRKEPSELRAIPKTETPKKTRPKEGYRLPRNQEQRRQEIVNSSQIAIKRLDEVLAMLGDDHPLAQVRIATAQRLIGEIYLRAFEMSIGPEHPTDKE